ncbi:EexN family lipoprotein [Escherichia coli]|nr:EexN family lipoprotein [Escherichia coli]
MKNRKTEVIATFTLFLMALVAGCKEETKSVDWWVSHPKETTEKYKDCIKTGEDTDNCTNVKQAGKVIADSYPPMDAILKQEAQKVREKMGL